MRDAAGAGIAGIAAERFHDFEGRGALHNYLAALAEKALAEQSSESDDDR